MARGPTRTPRDGGSATRRRIAVEAARLIAEQGLRDYHDAKLKAARRLGIHDDEALPRNTEIEEALREHQRLFQSGSQPAQLRRLREAAVEAMRFLARFEPRLVGPVAEGTADAHSSVTLHLFRDDPGEVLMFLEDHRIPFEERSRRLRTAHDHTEDHAVLVLSAGDVDVDLTILPPERLAHAPLDRVSGQPMRRMTLAALQALLASEGDAPPGG